MCPMQGAECPYCSTVTIINLDKFPMQQKYGLYDKCPDCGKVYGFDIEEKIVLNTYQVTNSTCQ